MALEPLHFAAMKRWVPQGKLLCLGYPDLLVPPVLVPPGTKVRPDGAEIARWHGYTGPVFDTTEVFRATGWVPTYVDISPSRREEKQVDLNKIIPTEYVNEFKGVCDPGTIEHCFNIGRAFRNIIDALEEGGVVCHVNPVTMTNHGFYNICPTAFSDFYEANGFEILEMKVLSGPVASRNVEDILEARTKRFALPSECSTLTVARKVKDVTFNWPTQSKYVNNPSLKG